MALQRVQNVQIRSARYGIETAQLRPGRYTANAHAIVVACGNDAGHGRAMVLVLRARHGPRAAHGPVRQLGQIVVAAVGYHVLAQVFVRHLDAVVHHGNAYVFAPVPAVQRAQMQVFAGHRAGLAAVIVQVPLQMCQRIGAGQRGRCRFVFVAQRTFGRTQQPDGGGLAGVRVIAVRLMCAVRFRGNTVRAIRARATGCAGGVPGRGSASRRAAGRWAARASTRQRPARLRDQWCAGGAIPHARNRAIAAARQQTEQKGRVPGQQGLFWQLHGRKHGKGGAAQG